MNKITGALIDEATHIRAIAKDVVLSGTYFYPIKGIIYTLNRPTLRQPLLSRSSKTLTLGVGVTTAMFFFTYVPQAAIMSITSGPLLAPFSAALLVLSESSTITTFLARSFLLADAITATFDATLVEMGQEKLLEQSGKRGSGGGDEVMSRFGGKEEVSERQTNMWNMLVRSVVLLPLNFVPVVGTLVYVYVQGKKVGEGVHERWFGLKGWKKAERSRWVGRWRGKYTGFGMAAFALEMVPFVSIAFAFTNTVGAALWAADWERELQ
ncbi:similar to An07g06140 [Aspergillus niger]|uniref:Similar to An07g06140 n=1 Tax=Aspergillus niger TaxID=5061 RepID=A0A117DYC2_ASPNG|nr:similar to An07g06140 [Aspergillus niger]